MVGEQMPDVQTFQHQVDDFFRAAGRNGHWYFAVILLRNFHHGVDGSRSVKARQVGSLLFRALAAPNGDWSTCNGPVPGASSLRMFAGGNSAERIKTVFGKMKSIPGWRDYVHRAAKLQRHRVGQGAVAIEKIAAAHGSKLL